MSTLLSLSITFLDDMFHGQGDDGPEWPPSPHRVYQALLCAAARNGCDGDDEFRWFESLDPPSILAPKTTAAQQRQIFVPNNDADANKKLARQSRLTSKELRPIRIQGDSTSVLYLWTISAEDEPMAKRVIHHTRRISAVGWGIDLVVADAQLVEAEVPAWGEGMQRWAPSPWGNNLLRCPCPGTLDDLRTVYESFSNRIQGKLYRLPQRPTVFREETYRTLGDIIRRPVACFRLVRPDDDENRNAFFLNYHGSKIVAAMARHATIGQARKFDFDFPGGTELYVAGHVGKRTESPPRFSYLPLPSIGGPHADGHIRRLIIAEPRGGDGKCCEWARNVLQLQPLIEDPKRSGTQGKTQAILQRVSRKSDPVFERYLESSRQFASVTPVFLSGYNDKKYSKTRMQVRKALVQAGYSLDDLDDIELQQAPYFPGALHSRNYRCPKYLKPSAAMTAIHVRLYWKTPIAGPLAIGAGRHCGLGVFA